MNHRKFSRNCITKYFADKEKKFQEKAGVDNGDVSLNWSDVPGNGGDGMGQKN